MNKSLIHIIVISLDVLFVNLIKNTLSEIEDIDFTFFKTIEAAKTSIFLNDRQVKLVVFKIDRNIDTIQLGTIKEFNKYHQHLKMIIIQNENSVLVKHINMIALQFFEGQELYDAFLKDFKRVKLKVF